MNSACTKGRPFTRFIEISLLQADTNREDEVKDPASGALKTDPFRVIEDGKMYCKVLEGSTVTNL